MVRKQCLIWALAVAAVAAGRVQAQSPETGFGDDFAKALAKGVITCIRPSTVAAEAGYEPRVVAHAYRIPKAGRLDLTVAMRWHGAFSRNPYDAHFTLKFQADAGRIEVLGIDYTDNCIFPAPDLRLLNALIRGLNEKLRR